MVRVKAVQDGSIAERARDRARDRAADGERPRARRLPRLGVPDRRRRAGDRGPPARRRSRRLRDRAPRRRGARRRARAADDSPLRQSLRVLLHRGTAEGTAQAALRPRRRLPAVLRLRQLRDALEREGARHRAHPRVPAVAALRLGARDAVGSAQGSAQQPARPEHRRAAHAARRGRNPVPRPDGDRARAERRRRARGSRSPISGTSATPCSRVAIVPVGLTQFSHLYTGKSDGRARTPVASSRPSSAGRRARWPSAATAGCTARTSCTCSPDAPLPDAEHYGDFPQIENGVGAVASLRERVRDGLDVAAAARRQAHRRRDRRLDGAADARAARATRRAHRRARSSSSSTENSLFGPTTTTAGLLVGADIRRALADRHDLDLALIPAETINDDGLFLDDERVHRAA